MANRVKDILRFVTVWHPERYLGCEAADLRSKPHYKRPRALSDWLRDLQEVTIDDKPKRRAGAPLKRLRNIAENPKVAVVADRYDEDWTRLGWVMLHGRADILVEGTEHRDAQMLLRSRYPQLSAMQIASRPVIAVRIERTRSWGNLAVVGSQDPRATP